MLYTVIFISGGAILALELLASRIMTPYFGVSLYIWTGILSITLVSLALGYWAGGKYSGTGRGQTPTISRLIRCFALMPAAAAIGIIAACLVYPYLFSHLANWSVVLGAFAACLILLFVPLVTASAMNPILVAILLHGHNCNAGDAGAGKVFFVSTIGSVAGVLVTAFGMIPYISNYAATLVVALTLALLSLSVALGQPAPFRSRMAVGVMSIVTAITCGLLLWQADAYTGRKDPASYGGTVWHEEASQGSLFGTVKILKSETDPASGRFLRIYFQDGLTQNTVDSNGQSMSFFSYALEALAYAYRPEMRSALVLGLGAGVVPMRLAERGVNVHVVEIDPVSLRFSRQFFGFDPSRVHAHQADARTFLRSCPQRFDAVVVDLFQGDGMPDYLATREFFRDLKRHCLADDGVTVFNTFADVERPAAYAHFLATLKAELPNIVLYRPDWAGAVHVNSFVVAGAKPLAAPAKVTLDDVPRQHNADLWEMLAHPVPVDSRLLAGGKIVTDAHNAAAYDSATAQLTYRRAAVNVLPRQFLLN